MKREILKMALVCLALFFVPDLSSGRTFYVSPGGAGSECSYTNPCALQTALDEAESNNEDDTVNLFAGTYKGNFSYRPEESEHKSITIKGAEGTTPERIVLDGQDNRIVLSLLDNTSGDLAEVLIEGLTLKNGFGGGLHALMTEYDITVRNCIIHDNRAQTFGGGAYLYSDYTVSFDNNMVYNNTSENVDYVGLPSSGGGAWIHSQIVYVRNNLIYKNLVRDRFAVGLGGGICIYGAPRYRSYLINNTIVQNEADYGGGFYLFDGTHYLYNNIIHSNNATKGSDICLSSKARGSAYYNDYEGLYGSWSEEEGNIAADPQFVSLAQEDFRLSRQSPCVNAGTNNVPDPPGLPDEDFEGDERVIDGTVDIGADERTSESTSSSVNDAATDGISVARVKGDGSIYLFVPSLLYPLEEGTAIFELLFKLVDIQSIALQLEDVRALSSAPGPISTFFNPGESLFYIPHLAFIDNEGKTLFFKNLTFSVGIIGSQIFMVLHDFLGDEAPTITEYIGGTKEVGSGVASDVARRYLDLMAYIESLLEGTTFTTPQPPAQGTAFDWDVEDW